VEVLEKLNSDSDEPISVVSIIGKSRKGARGCKAAVIDEAIGRNVFSGLFGEHEGFSSSFGCDIHGYYDEQNHVVFLHVVSPLDADVLVELTRRHQKEIHDKGFLKFWPDVQSDLIKCLLLVFLVSHIVVVVQPSIHFDLNYIQLFQLIDSARLKCQSQVTEVLSEISDLPMSWIDAGRACSPRLLFMFEAGVSERSEVRKNVRKYELFLEDQIYRFLRRSRIITNICANSLFAVCNQMNFVFISTKDSSFADPDAFFMQMLLKYCANGATNMTTTSAALSSSSSTPGSSSPVRPETDNEDDGHTFYNFLWGHLIVAQTKGFDDNVGRHPDVCVFVRPKVRKFFEVLKCLRELLFENSMDGKSLENNLRNLIDSEEEDDDNDDFKDDGK
jgi:protein SMG8